MPGDPFDQHPTCAPQHRREDEEEYRYLPFSLHAASASLALVLA
jgi:hypothetical protein